MRNKHFVSRLLSTLLAMCLLLAILPGASYMPEPTSGDCGPNAKYHFENGVMTLSGTGPVTSVRWGQTTMTNMGLLPYITTLIVEDGITALPSFAFAQSRLIEVSIPDSVVYVGDNAFSGTDWLVEQTAEFVMVGTGVLLDYNGPGGEVTIPDTVRLIAGGAFAESDITAVTIGSSVEEIGTGAFYHCDKLEHVSIADTVASIGDSAFRETPWLESQDSEFVIVGDHILIAYIGPGGAVVVPDTVRTISDGALAVLKDGEYIVTEVTIPNSVTKIGSVALYGGEEAPLVVHGGLGSAAQQYVQEHNDSYSRFRFVPFEQEDGSLFNFIITQKYYNGTFPDVADSIWYRDAVATVYERELMTGTSDWDWEKGIDAAFSPNGKITVAEAITVAVRVRDTYYYEQNQFVQGQPWYGVYVDYALKHGILTAEPDSYSRPATRAEFAALLAAALPARELEAVHKDVSFTDVSESHPNYGAVMALAQAGVMEGKRPGVFDPDAPVLRCEAAAMLSRCVCPEQRV